MSEDGLGFRFSIFCFFEGARLLCADDGVQLTVSFFLERICVGAWVGPILVA
jgi:hypothetical protein